MQDDTTVVDGDDYFDAALNGETIVVEPESNGDATPVGDVDSEATVDDHGEDALEVGDAEPADDDEEDPVDDDEPVDEWLPGFEGRFRPGDEAKIVESYRNLESEFSRRQNEFRDQLVAEREAAFEQAKQLVQAQQPQRSVVQELQERQQLLALAYQDPGTAFRAALQTGNDDTIDAVIQAVSQGDPELGLEGDGATALQMQGVVTQLRQQQSQAALARQVQELRAQAVIQPAAENFKHRYSDLLENESVAEAFQQTLTTNWPALTDSTDVEQINAVLERSLQQAVGHVAMNQGITAPEAQVGEPQEAPVQQRPAKRRPHTIGETGTARKPQRQEASPEEAYADEIFAAAREIRPAY